MMMTKEDRGEERGYHLTNTFGKIGVQECHRAVPGDGIDPVFSIGEPGFLHIK